MYVDDILLAVNYIGEINTLKYILDEQIKIKDLGLVYYFLGLEISTHPEGYIMHQHKHTLDLFENIDCSYFTYVTYPLNPSTKLT